MAHFHLNAYDEALACYGRALAAFRGEQDRQYEAIVLTHIGDAEHAAGDSHAARGSWRQALEILAELDHPDAGAVRAKLAIREIRPRTGASTARPAPTLLGRAQGLPRRH
jgi:predicted negative regulator of RcsB-dependent stress response